MGTVFLVLVVSFLVWFMWPFANCAFNAKCREEHLKPLILSFWPKRKARQEDTHSLD
ncbi:hypothetical protein JWV37_10350 [Sulfurospirillum sp. T05]|uniref:Uncharacterized protein n=1 Tax=Sulfurospirillum tamanense TaxID=2813362 RepID=A0ABS2WU59_9BACT|nr:hypothetical protein [Sulfurospirillum tamanensis]MBN2965182.1 hypothetical protein [Sulfurospirillum tamanensis]